jgi:hypothetical protein
MRKRIKQLLDAVPYKVEQATKELSASPTITPELLEAIMNDLNSGKVQTYEEIASKVGCTAEKIRLVAKPFPVIRVAKPHRIPDSVYRLILPILLAA